MFSWRRTLLRHRIVVNLSTGRALEGLLWAKRGRLIILRDTQMLESGAEAAPVDGEIVIESDRVEFYQVVS